MAANQPAAFAAILAGGLMLQHGLGAVKDSFHSGSEPATAQAVTSSAAVGGDAKQIRDYLVANGLTKKAAAGVVGNLQQESGLDPNAPGGGLAQWQGSRVPADMSLAGQLRELARTIQADPSLLAALNGARTPAQAATIFSNRYERPLRSAANLPARMRYATTAYGL